MSTHRSRLATAAPGRYRPVPLALLLAIAGVLGSVATPLAAQAVKWKPDPALPPPPVTHAGLVPGVTTAAELREKLGSPLHENSWYAYKMLYPSRGRPGHLDSFHLDSRDPANATLANIEAATIPDGLESLGKVRARLGEPEFLLELSRHTIADYNARGVRFVFDHNHRTIGVAYFPHGRTRVHSGARRTLSLRHLRQGPQTRPSTPASPAGLRVGAAEVDITPREAAWLGPAVKEGDFSVHDALEARCAVLERDGLTVAIVGADLFGMSKSEVDPIEVELRQQGIDHLVLASSHNHAAPDTIGIYGFFPAAYVKFIHERIRDGVLEAKRRLRPVKRWIAASDELPLDGARVEGLIRNARNPGLIDPQLAVMQAIGEDDRPIVTFVHFACHVEGLATGVLEASADFPGYLCDSLASDVGGQVIFLNGALGGMVSGDTISRTHEQAKIAGERFAREAKRILGFASPPAEMPFTFTRHRLEIPLTNAKLILFTKMSGRRQLIHGRIATELFHMRIGEAELLTVPGELLPELSFEILERMRGYPRLIVGLANDQLGYMLPGYDFNADQYEESMSLGPAAGPMVVAAARRIVERRRPLSGR